MRCLPAWGLSMQVTDVDPGRRAAVAIDGIVAASRRWDREHRRPPALSAREALAALEFEALLVAVAAASLADGAELSNADRERLTLAYRRIDAIASEVRA